MNCPTCGLSIRLRASYLAVERCPRCLARRQTAVPMYISLRPGGPPAEADEGAAGEVAGDAGTPGGAVRNGHAGPLSGPGRARRAPVRRTAPPE